MGIQRGAQSHSGMGENTMRVLNSGRSDRYIANIYILLVRNVVHTVPCFGNF